MSHLVVNIYALIHFYDDQLEAGIHSNAVKTVAGEELGIALFQHYLSSIGCSPARVYSPCTTKGAWLDGWIKVSSPISVLYQIEVKSWSMHGYGGKNQRIAVNTTLEALGAYKRRMWDHYWNSGGFRPKGLRKVLLRMGLPRGEIGPIEPVACLWTAVHPEGLEAEFFSVDPSNVENAAFPKVHIFSISSYLRNVLASGVNSLNLELPHTVSRMRHLNLLFQPHA